MCIMDESFTVIEGESYQAKDLAGFKDGDKLYERCNFSNASLVGATFFGGRGLLSVILRVQTCLLYPSKK